MRTMGLQDLPHELWTNHILQHMSAQDLDQLETTSRFLRNVSRDEAFWISKIRRDFSELSIDLNFVEERLNDGTKKGLGWAREYWKALYRPVSSHLVSLVANMITGCGKQVVEMSSILLTDVLSKQRVFIWGCADHGKLLLNSARVEFWDAGTNQTSSQADPQDITHLFPPHVGIAKLVAGERCFLAIDRDGGLWAWGRFAMNHVRTENDPFDRETMIGSRPFRIRLPSKAVAVGGGGAELVVIDEHGSLWNFVSFGSVSQVVVIF